MKYIVDAHREETRPLITSFFTIGDVALDPRECTQFLDLDPTEAGEATQKGTLLNGKPHIREAFWSIIFKKEPSFEIEEGLVKVIDIIWPRRREIAEFLETTGFSALFGTNVTIHASRPLYSLSPQTIRRMSYFGVEYLFDIFDYSE